MNQHHTHTPIKLRALKKADIDSCIKLFHETVHTINTIDYTAEQLNVWAPQSMNPKDPRWQTLLDNISFVAEINDQIVGFADMTHQGHLDRLYVHKDYQRLGIAAALVSKLEEQVKKLGINEITTEASITAKPFFEAMGYQIVMQQEKEVRAVKMINFVMMKILK